ncbi:MAG: prolipoprotein diacylglyceryl transferase family protein [Candidatus Gracilibacteria bacterium]|jgi:prolipoprotein diacylglyceryltransferase
MIPILYESQFVSIQTLWVFVALALLAGSYLAVQRLKRARVNFTLFIEHSGTFFLSALICSRIFYFVLHTDAYFPGFNLRTLGNFFAIWDQGFSFWGALLGFLLALTYRLYRSGENIWEWTDALIVPLLVGMSIGNAGAFLGGYAYGRPTDLFWGVRYEVYSVKYTVPVHPVQIYTILAILGVLGLKRHLGKKTTFFEREGNSTLYYSTFLSLLFFILEFFKGDDTLLILRIRLPIFFFALFFLLSGSLLLKRIKSFKSHPHESL